MTFLMAGGGTGGHVIPLIAVARELRALSHDAFFIGTDRGLEARLVPDAGFPLERIEIGGLNRVGLRQKLASLWQLPGSILHSRRLIRGRRAAAVFSLGGYVAGPPVLAAILSGTPVVVMEPNAIPGFTNRRIAGRVSRALVNFPETAEFFPRGRTEVIGLPVREEFFQLKPKPREQILTVLVTGGSQGSRTLNNAVRSLWPLLQKSQLSICLLHQAGRATHEELAAEFARTGLAGEVVPFISDMPAAFARSDLIVCRSGAGTVAELAAAGKPSVLVPFPFAADDHQRRNAEAFERAGAARVVADKDMTGERLLQTIADLIAQPEILAQMGGSARKFSHPGAARRAAEILIDSGSLNRNNSD